MNQVDILKNVIENNTDYFKLYRTLNPKSRATKDWTYYGSGGTVCRATCIYCRRVVSTCSNNWPKTYTFFREANSHTELCKKKWFSNLKVS